MTLTDFIHDLAEYDATDYAVIVLIAVAVAASVWRIRLNWKLTKKPTTLQGGGYAEPGKTRLTWPIDDY